MSPTRRIGLFGGSFDPVHRGHLHAARSAQDAFELDRVVFVPAARPPHKPERILADGPHRLRMLEIAVEPEPSWCVSDLELRRPGPSYTIDTVHALPAAVGEPEDAAIHLVIGSDNLEGLSTWHRARELLAEVQPVVVLRAGGSAASPSELVRRLPAGLLEGGLDERIARGLLFVAPVHSNSTDVRARLAAGDDVSAELPRGVWEYLRRHGIYRCA